MWTAHALFKAFWRVVALIFCCAALTFNAAAAPPLKTDIKSSQALGYPPCFSVRAAQASGFSPCRLLIQYDEGIRPAERYFRAHGLGAQVFQNYQHVSALAVVVPRAGVLKSLQGDAGVLRVMPDRDIQIVKKPAHAGGNNQENNQEQTPAGVERINALATGFSGLNVGVAVLDTGIDMDHPDLNVGDECHPWTENGSCEDGHGHGTHVAGTIAATDNEMGVVGVAPEATVYAVKVLSDSGSGSDATIIAGLDWVMNTGLSLNPPVTIVNMSLGRSKAPSEQDDGPLELAVREIVDTYGVVVVVAAGNDASMDVSQQVPAGYSEVISVASTTAKDGESRCRRAGAIPQDTASYFTTDGIGITISAPGATQENISRGCFIQSDGILSLAPGGGLAKMSGTSMAAPHVAGAVAQYLQKYPSWDTEDVKDQLAGTAAGVRELPLDSPASSYSDDGVKEGVLYFSTP